MTGLGPAMLRAWFWLGPLTPSKDSHDHCTFPLCGGMQVYSVACVGHDRPSEAWHTIRAFDWVVEGCWFYAFRVLKRGLEVETKSRDRSCSSSLIWLL